MQNAVLMQLDSFNNSRHSNLSRHSMQQYQQKQSILISDEEDDDGSHEVQLLARIKIKPDQHRQGSSSSSSSAASSLRNKIRVFRNSSKHSNVGSEELAANHDILNHGNYDANRVINGDAEFINEAQIIDLAASPAAKFISWPELSLPVTPRCSIHSVGANSSVSVPFLWEEAPGKPLLAHSVNSSVNPNHHCSLINRPVSPLMTVISTNASSNHCTESVQLLPLPPRLSRPNSSVNPNSNPNSNSSLIGARRANYADVISHYNHCYSTRSSRGRFPFKPYSASSSVKNTVGSNDVISCKFSRNRHSSTSNYLLKNQSSLESADSGDNRRYFSSFRNRLSNQIKTDRSNHVQIGASSDLVKANSDLIKPNPDLIKANPDLIRVNSDQIKSADSCTKPTLTKSHHIKSDSTIKPALPKSDHLKSDYFEIAHIRSLRAKSGLQYDYDRNDFYGSDYDCKTAGSEAKSPTSNYPRRKRNRRYFQYFINLFRKKVNESDGANYNSDTKTKLNHLVIKPNHHHRHHFDIASDKLQDPKHVTESDYKAANNPARIVTRTLSSAASSNSPSAGFHIKRRSKLHSRSIKALIRFRMRSLSLILATCRAFKRALHLKRGKKNVMNMNMYTNSFQNYDSLLIY